MSTSASINNIPTYTSATATKYISANDAKSADELQQEFLKMLTAQLEYQDPLEPVENTEFTSQLTAITSLGEQQRGNEMLSKLVESLSTAGVNQAVSYLGRRVTVEGSTINAQNGQGTVAFELEGASAATTVSILDADGDLVGLLEAGALGAGTHSLPFELPELENGRYTFQVAARALDGTTVSATRLESGVVTGVERAEDGTITLQVNDHDVAIDDIRRVEIDAA
ncbi:MAG: hypothetical protein H7831_12930 [Magnetococcus sp. WYHC-3]